MTETRSVHRVESATSAPPLRWASWVAVSSAPQATEDKVSLSHQKQLNQEHCAKHGGEIVAWLEVPGQSRHITTWEDACQEVQAYALLRDLIQRRQIDVLVFYDRTRLGRMASLVMTIDALCQAAGIALYETTSPPAEITATYRYDRQLIGAIGAVGAQYEIEKLKERWRIGITKRVERGQFAGRPNWGYYYRYDERGNRTVEVDANAASAIRQICALYLTGMGLTKIANALNAQGSRSPSGRTWTMMAIDRLLRSYNTYAGYAELNKRTKSGAPYLRAKGSWEPIISEEVRGAVEIERTARATNKNIPSSPHRFSAVCACYECGSLMAYYIAPNPARNALRCMRHRPIIMTKEHLVHDALEKAVQQVIAGEWGEMQVDPSGREVAEGRLAEIARRRKQIDQAYALADTAYINQQMTEERYSGQIAMLDARRTALDHEYAAAMGEYATESLVGSRAERLAEIARYGPEALSTEDTCTASAWLRRVFRVWCRHQEVVLVEINF